MLMGRCQGTSDPSLYLSFEMSKMFGFVLMVWSGTSVVSMTGWHTVLLLGRRGGFYGISFFLRGRTRLDWFIPFYRGWLFC